jgi:hypothetical protein
LYAVSIKNPTKLLEKALLIMKQLRNCTTQVRHLAFHEILHDTSFTDLLSKSRNCEWREFENHLESVKNSPQKADAVDFGAAILSSLYPFVTFLEGLKSKFKRIDLRNVSKNQSLSKDLYFVEYHYKLPTTV